MSTTIDERVVSMQFDNKQFEAGAKTSMSTLDKLKEKLSMANATKGLEDLGKAAKKLDFGDISINLDGVSAKFTAFQSFVHGIFESMGRDVYAFGKRLANSLTFDQITAGWSKYGEMATSVASIIAATGQTQEETYNQLDKLNWFSDATSYSLTQMTGAYSKFAAAGVDAESSMQAIMGLATAASRAGISASDSRFNNVLYNVSQSMGMGYLGTMDWRSLELAGIATVEFKNKLIEAGVEMGKLRKEGDKFFTERGTEVTAEGLRNTLSEQWVSKDVMLKGFGAYGGFVDEVYQYAKTHGVSAEQAMQDLADTTDQFGYAAMRSAQETKTWAEAVDATKDAVSTLWMSIFKDVIGNYEEAKEVWGAVAEFLYSTFAEPLETVERILSKWSYLGGRTAFIDGLKNAFAGFGSVIDAVKAGFKGLFPSLEKNFSQYKYWGKQLTLLTYKFRTFTENLKPSEETLGKITSAFKAVSGVLRIVKTLVSGVWSVFKTFFKSLGGSSKGILDVAAAFGEWVGKIADTVEHSEKLQAAFNKLSKVLAPFATFFRNFILRTWSRFESSGGGIVGVIKAVTGGFKDLAEAAIGAIENLTGWDLSKLFSGISVVIDGIQKSLVWIVELLTGQNDLTFWEAVVTVFTSIKNVLGKIVTKASSLFSTIVNGIKSLAGKINFESIASGLKAVWEWIKKIGTKVGSVIKDIVAAIKQLDFSDITEIFGSLAVGGAGVGIWSLVGKIKSFIDGLGKAKDSAKEKAGGLKDFLDGIKNALVDFSESLQKSVKVNMILKVAGAVLVLAIAMKTISSIPQEQLVSSFAAISGLLGEIVGSLAALSKLSFDANLKKAAAGMLLMSVAVLLLASAVKKLSDLSWEQLGKGMSAVTLMLIELTLVTEHMNNQNLIKTGVGLIAVAFAVKILASSVEVFASFDWEQLGKAGASIAVLLAALGGFTRIADSKNLITAGVGLIAVAYAIKILAETAGVFASMSWEQLGKAGASIVVLLGALGGFTRLADPKGMIAMGVAMLIMAKALGNFTGVAEAFGNMDWTQLGKAGAAIGGLLTLIAGFSVIMSKFGGGGLNMVALGVGLLAFGKGIQLVVSALQPIVEMSWEQLGKAGAAIAGLLLSISLALIATKGALLGAVSIFIVSAALWALMPVLLIFSHLSWEQIGKGLVMFAGALGVVIGAAALAQLVIPGLLVLAVALPLIGVGLASVGIGLAALSAGVAAMAAIGVGAIEVFLVEFELIVATILSLLPNIASALVAAITVFITTLAGSISSIIGALVEIGSAILSVIAQLLPQIVSIIGDLLLQLLELLIDLLPKIVELVIKTVSEIITGLTELIPQIVELAVTTVESVIAGIAELIPTVIDLALQMITGILQAIADNLPDLIQAGVDIVVNFVTGIGSAIPQLIDAGFKMIIEFIDGLATAINENTEPLLTAIDNLIWAIINAGVAVLTHGVDNFLTAGQTIMDSGLVQGIKNKVQNVIDTVKDFVSNAVQTIKDKVSEWLDAGKELITNVINGIKAKVEDLKTAAKNLIDDAKTAIVNKVTEWATAGKNIIDGLISGIKEKASAVIEAITGVIGDAIEWAKNLLGINSPSTVFKAFGTNTDQGYIDGVKALSGEVSDATGDMAQGAVNAFSDVIDKGFAFDELGEPVIKPVLDLEDVESGMDGIWNLFDDPMLSPTGSYKLAGAAAGSYGGYAEIQNGYDDSTVVATLIALRNDITSLGNQMSKMQIVMDTGATVGALAPSMNKTLGSYKYYKERGI